MLKQFAREHDDLNNEKGSYNRLSKFLWDRKHLKKVIMTIPYNASSQSMVKYLSESLVKSHYDEAKKTGWYHDGENKDCLINYYDIKLLIKTFSFVIKNDFKKISRLMSYLSQVATLCNKLHIPISWPLPFGLTINQCYFKVNTITISPFSYIKTKINLQVPSNNLIDKNKQLRGLMPNLIHSLDAHSLTNLYRLFCIKFKNEEQPPFYSVHDCFGTTCNKVDELKELLRIVYVDLYSDNAYLEKFDAYIMNHVTAHSNGEWVGRRYTDSDITYDLIDIDWVLSKKVLHNKIIKKILSQHIVCSYLSR